MNLYKKIRSLYIKHFYSLEKQARISGVKIGKNNLVLGAVWRSEAYLNEIGDDC